MAAARRYIDVDAKRVADLEPGDEIHTYRRAIGVVHSVSDVGGHVTVTWDDGSTQTFDLSSDPTVEVVVRNKAG